jgi:hypothetical protein
MDSCKKENTTRRRFVKGIAGAAVCGACLGFEAVAAPFRVPGQDSGEGKGALGAGTGREYLVAVCGLNCGACPMYLATQSKDEQKRGALLKQFASGPMKLKAEDLMCDGCLGSGRVASFCRSCAIRACPKGKSDVTRCSDCPDFPCSRITGFNNDGMLHHAEVLDNLRRIREMGIREWAKYDEERWQCPQCRLPVSWYDSKCSGCGAARSGRLFKLIQG